MKMLNENKAINDNNDIIRKKFSEDVILNKLIIIYKKSLKN